MSATPENPTAQRQAQLDADFEQRQAHAMAMGGSRKLDRGIQTIDPAPELDNDVILHALGRDPSDLITGAEQGAERGGLRSRGVISAVGRDPEHGRG